MTVPLSLHQDEWTGRYDWVESVWSGGYRTTTAVSLKLPRGFEDTPVLTGEPYIRNGWLHIPVGFWFDGASGPAIDGMTNLLASLGHDALYLLVRKYGVGSCVLADQWYANRMTVQQANPVRVWVHYYSLAVGGPIYRWRSQLQEDAI